jgi:hypothetical protein
MIDFNRACNYYCVESARINQQKTCTEFGINLFQGGRDRKHYLPSTTTYLDVAGLNPKTEYRISFFTQLGDNQEDMSDVFAQKSVQTGMFVLYILYRSKHKFIILITLNYMYVFKEIVFVSLLDFSLCVRFLNTFYQKLSCR